MKTRKKGLSHIEFIVSLIIFMAFVLFLLVFLNPVKEKNNPAVLDSFEKQILDYSKIDVLTGSLIVNSIGGQSCFTIESLSDKNVIVRKDSRIKAENFNEKADDIDTKIENKGEGLYNLYYSDDFNESGIEGNCDELNGSSYSLGLTREIKIVSLEKLKSLADIYNNRYADAKEELNMKNDDFGFIVYSLNGTEILRAFKQKTNENTNAREISVEVIDENADIKSVMINLRVW